MAVKKWNQLKYTDETIGETGILLRRYGCTICCICSVWSRFYPKGTLRPQVAAKTWKFTPNGLLYWSSEFEGMEFVKREYYVPTNDELALWVRSKERGMILEVDKGAHWVMVWYYPLSIGIKGCMIIDSLGGKARPFALTGYKCTGFATFQKTK